MSNVNLTIGSRSFAVACADGEEAHVADLGRLIDEKAAAAGAQGQTETRMLLFAALLLADEVHELRQKGGGEVVLPEGLTDRLGEIAGRIENIASLLESSDVNA